MIKYNRKLFLIIIVVIGMLIITGEKVYATPDGRGESGSMSPPSRPGDSDAGGSDGGGRWWWWTMPL